MNIGILWLVASLSNPALAQGEPRITVDGHGSVVNTQGAVLMQVTGTVQNLDPAETYHVWAHTTEATINPGGTWVAQMNVDGVAGQDLMAPYRGWFGDKPRVFLPILGELRDDTGAVLSRDRALVYNIAGAAALEPHHTNGPIEDNSAQLTPSGLTELQPTYRDLIPMPDLPEFQADLDGNIPGVPAQDYSATEICAPMPDTDDWQTLMKGPPGDATRIMRGVYDTAMAVFNQGGPGAGVAFGIAQQQCVRRQPEIADFEVCVDRVELELTDATVEDVLEPTLTFLAPSNQLSSEPKLVVSAKSIARLRSLQIKNVASPVGCTLHPTPYNLPNQTIEAQSFLDDYTTCPLADLAVAEVEGRGIYSFLNGAAGDELLQWFHLVGSGIFGYPVNSSVSVAEGCPQPAYDPAILEGTTTFQALVSRALEDTWYANASNHETDALAWLFEAFEVGTATMDTYDLMASVSSLVSSDISGAVLHYKTEADPLDPLAIQPIDFLWYPPRGIQNYPQAVDENGAGFDVMYDFTINSLNQMLRARSVDERFDNFQLTYGDVSDLPANGADDETGIWTTADLTESLFDPIAEQEAYDAFTNRGPYTYTIEVMPTLAPFTFMDPDPITIPAGAHDLTYQLGQYSVRLVDNNGLVVYRMIVDLYEPNLTVSVAPTSQYVDFTPSATRQWTWTAVDPLRFPGCPREDFHSETGCDVQIRDALIDVLTPFVHGIVDGLISQAPGPFFFDRAGYATQIRASDTLVWKAHQRITIFAGLQPHTP